MGRPLNKKYFGSGANKIAIEAWIPGGSGVVAAEIVKETGNGEYIVTDGSDTGTVELQAADITAEGQARVAVVLYDGIPNVTATADADLTGGEINAITVTDGGSGYTVAPTVTITGDGTTPPTATAIISGGAVTGINVDSDGSADWTTATVTISAPAAGGATEYARIINAHHVKTWDDNTYRWGVGVSGEGTANILTPEV